MFEQNKAKGLNFEIEIRKKYWQFFKVCTLIF